MKQKKIIIIGKWVAMGTLGAFNVLSYLLEGSFLNVFLGILIFLYSIYEFFRLLSEHRMHLGIKMYLFTFYLFAVISLILGLRSFLAGNVNQMMLSFLFIAGDVALILYTIHKLGTMK